MLSYEDICKSYGDEVILKDLKGRFRPGEMTVIMGESGSGKTTLISILGLLLRLDSGSVILDGRDLLELDDEEQARIRNRRFGFLFQHPQLIGSIRIVDNVMVPALLSGRGGHIDGEGEGPKRDMRRRAETLLEKLKLAHRMDHYPFQLSIGQKRRASLARAMMMDPDIFFADEPTNDLDRENASIVKEKLLQMREQGKTMIIVTHDESLASVADLQITI